LTVLYARPVLADPGNRAPAPEPLRLVQAFVNTRDIENRVDELASPDALARAFAALGVPVDGTPSADELVTARAAREALRALTLANSGIPADADALAVLDRVAEAARYTVRFDDGHARLVPRATGVDGSLGAILAIVHRSMADGTWWRLKGCPRDVCHWAFYDRSRNGSGKWCAMSVCGNRTNTKTYRRRVAARR
jgi:predicted RNA-binding Zn ribbon-like protein